MKKMRGEPCNFCEFSGSRYGCGSEQDQDNDNDKEAELRENVQKLRFLLMKMTGRDEDISFTELKAFESRLQDARRIVLDQKKKKELEEDEQKKKAEDEDDGTRKKVSVPSKSSTSSTENRQEKQDIMWKFERTYERRKSESLQRKFERLWLFNERMNGREIENMTSHDLLLLDTQILQAINGLKDQMMRPLQEQRARQRKP